jgi:hypothetical protein
MWCQSWFALGIALLLVTLAQAQTNDDILRQGLHALEARDFAGARQAFSQLVLRAPTPQNYENLASADAAAGQLGLAIAHLQKSIQLGNRTARAHYNLGLLFMQTQKPIG